MSYEKISTNQNVYSFRGNNYPYLFFSNKSTNGFVKDNYFYKESIINTNEEEKEYNYTKTNFKIYEEKSKLFKHIVNFMYYLLLLVVLYSAYVSDNLIVTIIAGTFAGIGLRYLIKTGSTILMLGGIVSSISLIIYLLVVGSTDAPFAVFYYAILFYQIYENLTKDDLVYKIDSKPNGYYIWTTGEPLHKVKDRLGKKVSSLDGAILADFKEKKEE